MRKNVPAAARWTGLEKTSRLQPREPGALVSWDEFNFRLHEKFRPASYFSYSAAIITLNSFLAYQLQDLIP